MPALQEIDRLISGAKAAGPSEPALVPSETAIPVSTGPSVQEIDRLIASIRRTPQAPKAVGGDLTGAMGTGVEGIRVEPAMPKTVMKSPGLPSVPSQAEMMGTPAGAQIVPPQVEPSQLPPDTLTPSASTPRYEGPLPTLPEVLAGPNVPGQAVSQAIQTGAQSVAEGAKNITEGLTGFLTTARQTPEETFPGHKIRSARQIMDGLFNLGLAPFMAAGAGARELLREVNPGAEATEIVDPGTSAFVREMLGGGPPERTAETVAALRTPMTLGEVMELALTLGLPGLIHGKGPRRTEIPAPARDLESRVAETVPAKTPPPVRDVAGVLRQAEEASQRAETAVRKVEELAKAPITPPPLEVPPEAPPAAPEVPKAEVPKPPEPPLRAEVSTIGPTDSQLRALEAQLFKLGATAEEVMAVMKQKGWEAAYRDYTKSTFIRTPLESVAVRPEPPPPAEVTPLPAGRIAEPAPPAEVLPSAETRPLGKNEPPSPVDELAALRRELNPEIVQPEVANLQRGVARPAEQPPEAWLMGATQQRERAGMSPKDALADAVRAWRDQEVLQRRFESEQPPETPAFREAPREVAPPFFSQLQREIDQRLPARATPEQVRNIVASGAVKADEVKWSGLEDYLASLPTGQKVDKADLQRFLRENEVRVEEVTLRTAAEGEITPEERATIRPPKFSRFTLPGGKENYRELLLTWARPPREIPGSENVLEGFARSRFRRSFAELTPEQRDVARQETTGARIEPGYHSRHWDEPNVLAHVRFNDRTDAEGKRILFIEELQSDWHQEGRRKGYGLTELPPDRYAVEQQTLGERGRRWIVRDLQTGRAVDEGATAEEARRRALDFLNTGGPAGRPGQSSAVPPAPFAKTWHELVLKRMLRWAAEKGYDKVAWTTGEQQAERYDLSKQVKSISYFKHPEAESLRETGQPGQYDLSARTHDNRLIDIVTRATPAELDRYVGKDLAEKIRRGEGEQKGLPGATSGIWREFSGLDLKVGGEGMRAFYDQMLPQFLNKYGKKWGARVGETYLRAEGETKRLANDDAQTGAAIGAVPVPALDITPEMRRSVVQEGQPMFLRAKPFMGADPAWEADWKQAFQASSEHGRVVLGTGVRLVDTWAERTGEELSAFARQTSYLKDVVTDLRRGLVDVQRAIRRDHPTFPLVDIFAVDLGFHDYAVTFLRTTRPMRMAVNPYQVWHRTLERIGEMGEFPSRRERLRVFEDEFETTLFHELAHAFTGEHRETQAVDQAESMLRGRYHGILQPALRSIGDHLAQEGTYERLESDYFDLRGREAEDVARGVRAIPPENTAREPTHDLSSGAPPTGESSRGISLGSQPGGEGRPRSEVGVGNIPQGGPELGGGEIREAPTPELERSRATPGGVTNVGRPEGPGTAEPQLPIASGRPEGVSLQRGTIPGGGPIFAPEGAGRGPRPEEGVGRRGGIAGVIPESAHTPVDLRAGIGPARREAGQPPEPRPDLTDRVAEAGKKFAREDFAQWAESMRGALGPGVEPYLRPAWDKIQGVEARSAPETPPPPPPEPPVSPPSPPRTAEPTGAPPEGPPPLEEPHLKLEYHKQVVDAAGEMFDRAGIARDKDRWPVLSDQILDAMVDGTLQMPQMQDILQRHGLDLATFGEQMWRSTIRRGAQGMQILSVLQRRLNRMAAEAGTAEEARALLSLAEEAEVLRREGAGEEKLLSWWRRADNVRRGLLVTQLATAVRNAETQIGRLGIDVLDQAVQKMFGGTTADPWAAWNAFADTLSQLRPTKGGMGARQASRQKINALLEAFPKEWDRLFGSYSSDIVRQAQESGTILRGANKAMATAEQVVHTLNFFNRFQEFSVRRAVFWNDLKSRVERRGIDLEALVRGERRLTQEEWDTVTPDLKASVQKALEMTFAQNAPYGSLGWHFVQAVNKLPLVLSGPLPFPRFMVNSLKFLYEFSPMPFLKLLSASERAKITAGNTKLLSRASIGTAALLGAWLIREMQPDDNKWYEVDVPGIGTTNITPFNPFAAYFFLGELAKRTRTGTRYRMDWKDIARGVASANVSGGLGLFALDKMIAGLGELSKPGKTMEAAKQAGGEVLSGLLVPLRTLTDLYAQFDPEWQVVRERRGEPFLGPAKAQFAMGEPLARATRAEPQTREAPALRQLTGVTKVTEKNDLERELDRLQFSRQEIQGPSTGDPVADNLVAKYMGELAESQTLPKLAGFPYQGLSDAQKMEWLRRELTRVRAIARARAKRENPDLFREVKEGLVPSRRRLLNLEREEQGLAPARGR